MRTVVIILTIILIVMIVAFFTISPKKLSGEVTTTENPAESKG